MAKRSRYGCQTCKIRKVKCDESLPFCKQCTGTGRRCDGPSKNKTMFMEPTPYTQQRTVRPGKSAGFQHHTYPRPDQLTLMPDLQSSDKRALAFFVESASPALGGELYQDFWHRCVLQLCHQSSMVRDAVLAVSVLYEKPLSNPLRWPTSVGTNFAQPQHRQAFRWYSQSLSGMSETLLRPGTQEQLHLALTSCILFASIEIQQLNVANSIKLLNCGYSLLSQEKRNTAGLQRPLVRHILLPVFIRQTILMMLHGYPLADDWLPDDLNDWEVSSPVSSLQEAQTRLFLLMLEGFGILKRAYMADTVDAVVNLQLAQTAVLEKVDCWHRLLENHVSGQSMSTFSIVNSRAINLLQINYFNTVIWLSACLAPSELVYDKFTREFESLLDHVEAFTSQANLSEVAYTFDMGVIPPLYFVGWRCRIPHIRRRALQLLRKAPAQESLFHRDVATFAVKKIIEVEEGLTDGFDVESTKGIVPEERARLRHTMVRWDGVYKIDGHLHGSGTPYLVYSSFPLEEDQDGNLKNSENIIRAA